jgi:molybdopterin-guanine dinucleotide biosynthesis protein A
MAVRFDAVILAGGRGSRLGGVSKPELEVDGRRLLDAALAAASGAERTVVVGDVPVPAGVLRTREDPAFGGPVAGLEAGMAALRALVGQSVSSSTEHGARTHTQPPPPWTLVLASDLPEAPAAVEALLAADAGTHDGVCLLDADGRLQWLLGCYRTPVLAARLAARGEITAMYRLLEPLDLLGVPGAEASTVDLDTPDDVAAWAARGGER